MKNGMKKPSVPGGKRGQRKRIFAKTTSSTKLFVDDYKTVGDLMNAWDETEAGVIRIIVHDWIRSQRVRALGRDEASEQVRAVYERVVSEQVAPLAAAVLELKGLLGQTARTRRVAYLLEAVAALAGRTCRAVGCDDRVAPPDGRAGSQR